MTCSLNTTLLETFVIKSKTKCLMVCSKSINCAYVQIDDNKCITYSDLKCDNQVLNKTFWSKQLNANNSYFECSGILILFDFFNFCFLMSWLYL